MRVFPQAGSEADERSSKAILGLVAILIALALLLWETSELMARAQHARYLRLIEDIQVPLEQRAAYDDFTYPHDLSEWIQAGQLGQNLRSSLQRGDLVLLRPHEPGRRGALVYVPMYSVLVTKALQGDWSEIEVSMQPDWYFIAAYSGRLNERLADKASQQKAMLPKALGRLVSGESKEFLPIYCGGIDWHHVDAWRDAGENVHSEIIRGWLDAEHADQLRAMLQDRELSDTSNPSPQL